MKVKFYTLGCKVNQYETEYVSEIFEEEGYEIASESEDSGDVFVVNTCSVTNLSESKSRQIIRRAKRENPDSIIVVMGCYSQVAAKEVEKIEEVDIVVGTTERNTVLDLVKRYQKSKEKINVVRDISKDNDFQPIDIENLRGMTRAYLKVQDGCNRYCSYCIIPYARGNIRSRDPKDVKLEVIRLSKNNYKEVVLTGIHIASYGKDLENYELIDLIEDIHEVEGIERIRLSSVEPRLITEEFLERLKKLPKFCDHFHLSLQSGSNTVLERMNRKYTREEYIEKVDLIREFYPDAGITTDIIVGFPGETEEEFNETLDLVKQVRFSKIHIFKYSIRKGTKAATMKDQIDGNIKTERSKILSDLERTFRLEFMKKMVKRTLKVLVEREIDGIYYGHTTNYLEIGIKGSDIKINQIIDVIINEVSDEKLFGYIE